MDKQKILSNLVNQKLVAVLRKIDKDKIQNVVGALIDGGINCIEITIDSDGALDCISKIKEAYGHKICVGVGTVLDEVSCRMAIIYGAEYIVTPALNSGVINMANKYGVACVSGAMTPTEILTAYENGADMVKVFPAGTLGPNYFKEIGGPLSHVPIMATGGLTLDNISDFRNAGVKVLGIGSFLTDKNAIRTGDYKKIEDMARKLRQIIDK